MNDEESASLLPIESYFLHREELPCCCFIVPLMQSFSRCIITHHCSNVLSV
jgi:hypothetical protein